MKRLKKDNILRVSPILQKGNIPPIGQNMFPTVPPTPSYDNSIKLEGSGDGGPINGNFQISNNPNRVLLAAVFWGTPRVIATITYGGVTLTPIGTAAANGSSRYQFYILVAPPTGTNAFALTLDGAAVNFSEVILSSYYNVDQVTPQSNVTAFIGNSGTASLTVTSGNTGKLVVDSLMVNFAETITPGAGQTQRLNLPGNQQYGVSTKPGAASVDMSWTFAATFWNYVATSLNVAA